MRDEYLKLKERQDGLLTSIHELEVFNSQVVKDHVDALATQELEERRKQEELEQIRQENASMREQIR